MQLRQTERFAQWLRRMGDLDGRARIQMRLDRAQRGLLGDVKALGGGVSEMRIDAGPGYRVYFTRRGEVTLVLLAGGDKRSQDRTSSKRGPWPKRGRIER